MRNNSLLVLAFATLLSAGFVACGDDDDDVAPGQGTPSSGTGQLSSGLRVTRVGDYTFEYDSEGRLTRVSEGNYYSYKFSYNPNKITEEYYGDDEESYSVGYNSNGYMSSLSYEYVDGDESESGRASFSYDGEGHLIKITTTAKESGYDYDGPYSSFDEGTLNLIWKDGRLTNVVDKYSWKDSDGDSGNETDTWTYDFGNNVLENKYLQFPPSILRSIIEDYDFLGYVGILGNGPKYLPSSAKYVEVENGDVVEEHSYSYSYGFNNDGSLSYCISDGSRYGYSYESQESVRKAPALALPQNFGQGENMTRSLRNLFRRHIRR